ncbi:MAG: 50S ribosomal protein L37ae [Candidatus ainarchaeum sp.]|nr:50S ribosomal protein L37ae [Candidatus ainarchaeum sp.]
MVKTKKVRSTGRFGSRYGVGIKKRVLKVEDKQNSLTPCPFCGFDRIKRESAGLYNCTKCNAKFTGGAYVVETLIGKTVKKIIAQKTFVTDTAELIKVTEKENSYSDIENEVSKVLDE